MIISLRSTLWVYVLMPPIRGGYKWKDKCHKCSFSFDETIKIQMLATAWWQATTCCVISFPLVNTINCHLHTCTCKKTHTPTYKPLKGTSTCKQQKIFHLIISLPLVLLFFNLIIMTFWSFVSKSYFCSSYKSPQIEAPQFTSPPKPPLGRRISPGLI